MQGKSAIRRDFVIIFPSLSFSLLSLLLSVCSLLCHSFLRRVIQTDEYENGAHEQCQTDGQVDRPTSSDLEWMSQVRGSVAETDGNVKEIYRSWSWWIIAVWRCGVSIIDKKNNLLLQWTGRSALLSHLDKFINILMAATWHALSYTHTRISTCTHTQAHWLIN